MNILKEVTAFAYKYTSQELFDTAMLNAMKVILSYVEKKTDIIISDYHYLLAIPLLVAFSEERWMLSQPTELIGFFFSILDIVKFLDPAGGLRTAVTDDSKEFVRVGEMLDLLERYDPTLREHIQKFMAEESNRKSFTILYRKFVQSLGFNYINVDSCLFLWDQIFLKVKPLPDEMSQAFVALLLAAKEELMLSSKFSEFAEMVYLKGKAVSIDAYISKYIQVSAGATFYEERYNYEEIPVEAIKLDKVNLSPVANPDAGLSPEDERLLEDNMEQIIKQNVMKPGQEFPDGDGMLFDQDLLRDLDKAALDAVNNPDSKRGGGDPIMSDYKSVKQQPESASVSKKPPASLQGDILADLPKKSSKPASEKKPKSQKDSFSLQQSGPPGKSGKSGKSGEEELNNADEVEEQQMGDEEAKSKASKSKKSGEAASKSKKASEDKPNDSKAASKKKSVSKPKLKK